MKKFISMVMAAAMVVSLVPATAFAKGDVTATAKVVDAVELAKGNDEVFDGADGPEVQLKITNVDYQKTYAELPKVDVTVTLDKAEFVKAGVDTVDEFLDLVKIKNEDGKDIKTTNVNEATPATGSTTTTTTYPEVSEATYAAAIAANPAATGLLQDGKYTAFADMTAKAEVPAVSVEDQKAALEEKGYVLTMIDGASKYVLFGANNAIKDVQDVPTAEIPAVPAQTVEEQADAAKTAGAQFVYVVNTNNTAAAENRKVAVTAKEKDIEDDEMTFTFTGFFEKGDIISIDLLSKLTKTSEGTKATVSVDSDMVTLDDAVFASILGKGLKASVKKVVDVAEEEKAELNSKGLTIESVVGNFEQGQEITLKVSKGFEFVKSADIVAEDETVTVERTDDNELTLTVTADGAATDEIVLTGIEVEATSAKSGATATITVKSSNWDSATVEVAKVVDYKVVLSVDEDEDVPVIYSGVNVDNYGITDDSDHMSLEVTAEETFPGAWSMRKGFSFELPEGVYVTDVDVIDTENFLKNGTSSNVGVADWEEAFVNAYQDGDHLNFEFEKRVFDDVNNQLEKDPATLTFKLELVADPTFEGDVVLKLTGDLVDEQEVTIAKFVKPYTVKAEQNDLIIDYRYTDIPTAITITEAEAGLWAKDEAVFEFAIERGDLIQFEDDATFEIDKDSELEIDDFTREKDGVIGFEVDAESDEAATVTIKDMQLFMQRNIPAGPYDLTISSSLENAFLNQKLFAPDEDNCTLTNHDDDKECYVDDIDDYSDVVKEAFVNVVTAGRDQDDASFTTKVVVPVGESYIISGETQVALDVPAYINAAGYTMLPVRAVATALGILNNNVLWDQPTRTVTILYGQRIITMSAGQKVVYVNGSAIPASASVEITNGRTFLPMRDLATALGVTDITWDAATKTATLNGNQK